MIDNILRIKDIRKSKKLTQSAVAGQVGISTSHFNRIENGHSWPERGTLEKIANVLGVTIEDLLADRRIGHGKDFCPNEGIKAKTLEEGIAQIIGEIYDEEQIEKLIGQRLSAQRSREKSVVDLRREKKDVQKRLERLEEAYMTGKMDPDYFLELSGPLKARLEDVDEELSKEREADKIDPKVLRQAIGIFLDSLAGQPESLRNFVQELTIFPHKNGERRIELSLAVRLPREKVSKLGINMVAVPDFDYSHVYRISARTWRYRGRQYAFGLY